MDELLGIFCILGIVLLVVTFVGHGIWVIVSALFSTPSAAPTSPPASRQQTHCPRCLTPLSSAMECPACGWPAFVAGPNSQGRVLEGLERHLERLGQIGAVNAETSERLAAAISLERERIGEETAAAAPPPAKDEPTAAEEVTLAEMVEPAPAEVASPPPEDAAARVRKYVASRTVAAAEVKPDEKPVAPPRHERLSNVFAAFMEEKNIRWGELIGGLLIVGGSIALVISFWSEIAQRPLLKFVLFNSVTAALFGLGIYAHRRWKLRTTSQGVLIIATLLVPLNVLTIAAFTEASPPTDVLSIGGEVISLAVFSALIYLAARIITPDAPLLTVVGVMVPCVMQLLTRRFVEPASTLPMLYAMAAIPIGCYLAVGGIETNRLRRADALDEPAANALFVLLGMITYATLLPLGLLLFKTHATGQTLHELSPLVTLLGVPGLAAGLVFWSRMTDRELAAVRTAGISVGVLGAAVMAAAVVLAWPDPATLLPVAILNAVVFTGVAVWFGIPAAHYLGGPCIAGGWLVAFHLYQGNVTWNLMAWQPLARAVLSAASGTALVPLVALFGLVVAMCTRADRRADAAAYAGLAAATAAVSLLLVTWFGAGRIGDPHSVTWVYALYAVGAIGAAVFADRLALGWFASALALAALVQGLVFRYAAALDLHQPWIVALLSHATLSVVGAVTIQFVSRRSHVNLRQSLTESALVTSVLAVPLIALAVPVSSAGAISPYLFWVSGAWLVLAFLTRRTPLFTAFQAMLAVSVFAAVTAAVEGRPWYAASRLPWFDPWFLQLQGIAMATYGLFWSGVRFAAATGRRKRDAARRSWFRMTYRFLNPSWPAVDRLMAGVVVVLLVWVACYAAVPGAAQELAPRMAVAGKTPPPRIVPPAEMFELGGAPHEHAAGRGSWLLLAAVVAMLAARIPERRSELAWAGVVLALAMICPLVSSRWESEVSVASALRWSVALFFAAASVPIWLRTRLGATASYADRAARSARITLLSIVAAVYVAMAVYVVLAAIERAGIHASVSPLFAYFWILLLAAAVGAAFFQFASMNPDVSQTEWVPHARNLLLLLGVGPLLVATLFAVAMALMQYPIVGPEPGALFRRVVWSISYAVPVVIIVATVLGHAVRERSSRYAFTAGLLFNVAATAGFMLILPRLGRGLDPWAWVNVGQINTIVSAGFALSWLAAVVWDAKRASRIQVPTLLTSTVLLAAALCALSIAPATAWLTVQPLPALWVVEAGKLLGWLGLVLTAAALAWLMRIERASPTVHGVGGALVALSAIVPLTLAHWDGGNWLAYRALLVASALSSWLIVVAARLVDRGREETRQTAGAMGWAVPLGIITVLLALRELYGDTFALWWTAGSLMAMSGLAAWLAWLAARRAFLYAAGVLINLAASIWWVEEGHQLTAASGFSGLVEFLHINVLAAALPALAWVAIERRRIRPVQASAKGIQLVGFHRVAALGALVMMLLTVGLGLTADALGEPLDASPLIAWAAIAATAAAVVACLWDPATRFAVASLYLVGLAAVGLMLDQLDLEGQLFTWALTMVLAAYSLATSYLWSRRAGLRELAARLGAAVTVDEASYRGLGWLVPANVAMAVLVTGLVFWIELTLESVQQRMSAANALLAQAFAVGLLARGRVRSPLQYSALVLGVLFAVAVGWASLPLTIVAPVLHRTVMVAVALAVMIVVYGFGLVKLLRRENEWTRAAERLVPLLVTAAIASVLLVVGIETLEYVQVGEVPIVPSALVAVALALLGLSVAALAAAVLPGRDPLGLSERGRMAYVYAAEALLAVLFLHIRVTMPWLFTGWFMKYWPLVVMAIAFVGVGLGEWFQRRRARVLSEPLETTGALLPILPVLGYWVLPGEVDYSLLLLSVGVLYAAISVMRQSFLYAILAALAINGSLWYLLYKLEGLGLAEHPQLWLIPPTLCVLAGAYLNRDQLSDAQMTTIRYMAAIVIYVSSTADIFINGVAQAPWLPLVLAGISIVGIFAGIMLRIRAFLYLGTSFLMVALFTVIWHAAVELDQTWVWWVSLIVAGALILALFAAFEKKRDDFLRLVDELKQWKP